MKLSNPSQSDVVNFPIEEPRLVDEAGNILLDIPKTGYSNNEGIFERKHNLWSIKSGEEKVFPNYVGKQLKKIYGFLREL